MPLVTEAYIEFYGCLCITTQQVTVLSRWVNSGTIPAIPGRLATLVLRQKFYIEPKLHHSACALSWLVRQGDSKAQNSVRFRSAI